MVNRVKREFDPNVHVGVQRAYVDFIYVDLFLIIVIDENDSVRIDPELIFDLPSLNLTRAELGLLNIPTQDFGQSSTDLTELWRALRPMTVDYIGL